MKLERKNFSSAANADLNLSDLERTMVASIALMKRLRREARRSREEDTRRSSRQ